MVSVRRETGRQRGIRLSMRSRVDAPLQKKKNPCQFYINWRCKCDVLAPHETENNKGHPDRQTDRHEDQPDALPTESNAKYATVFDVRPGTVTQQKENKIQEAEVSIAPAQGLFQRPWAGLVAILTRWCQLLLRRQAELS